MVEIDVTKMTKEALANSGLGTKDIDRCKNMFVLGFLLWMYNRSMETTQSFITEKFSKKPDIKDANLTVLKAGYYFGDTNETFTSRYEVESANLPSGEYAKYNGKSSSSIGCYSRCE